MYRRTLLKSLGSLFLGTLAAPKLFGKADDHKTSLSVKDGTDREYWVSLLSKMAAPILSNIGKDEFQKNMPMVVSPTYDNRNPKVGYMEAFARLLSGMAPWFDLPDDASEEGKLRKKLKEQALAGIHYCTDPNASDYFIWNDKSTTQPLVEAAFLAHAFIRAPQGLWDPLAQDTKDRVIKEFKGLRRVQPFESNWLLFAAIVEAFLYSVGEKDIAQERIDKAVHKFDKEWYAGDGWYSDGKVFGFDHYNGYVIHCMQVDTLKCIKEKSSEYKEMHDRAYKRMQRYAHHQERMISPEGYPLVVGRSSTYRNGAFQPLAAVALDDKLPEDITRSQVRAALTAVLKNTYRKNNFTKEGWLTMGYVGDNQQNLADYYTNVGSVYLASFSFLPLGLPADHPFWTDKAEKWTSQKVFDGDPFPKDYVVNY